MPPSRLKEFQRLEYGDPAAFLSRMYGVHVAVAHSGLPKQVRTLRTNELKPWREFREGCLFAYGLSVHSAQEVLIAKAEKQNCDYDCVLRWVDPDKGVHYGPVQIKEVVPDELNPTTSVQTVVDKLTAYAGDPKLTVALHLNRKVEFAPTELSIPKLQLGALWVFGSVTPGPFGTWALWGDFLSSQIHCTEFQHPL